MPTPSGEVLTTVLATLYTVECLASFLIEHTMSGSIVRLNLTCLDSNFELDCNVGASTVRGILPC